jgi:hypothetical protein
VVSVGGLIAGMLIQRLCIAPFWVLLGSAPLQIIGLILMGYSSANYLIQPEMYGYQVILGLGFGGTVGTAIMMIPLVCDKRDVGKSTSYPISKIL